MEQAAAPSMPARRRVLGPRSESGEGRRPRRLGVARRRRRASRGAPNAQAATEGVADFRRF
eukprot:15308200-Alexandrium_andersonii.AAC.1